jgi:hypothetical protein
VTSPLSHSSSTGCGTTPHHPASPRRLLVCNRAYLRDDEAILLRLWGAWITLGLGSGDQGLAHGPARDVTLGLDPRAQAGCPGFSRHPRDQVRGRGYAGGAMPWGLGLELAISHGVIPAKAGIYPEMVPRDRWFGDSRGWIPAFAGMTRLLIGVAVHAGAPPPPTPPLRRRGRARKVASSLGRLLVDLRIRRAFGGGGGGGQRGCGEAEGVVFQR